VASAGGSTVVRNTIVANNVTQPSGPAVSNCAGVLTSQGNNLDNGNTCGFTASGDLQNTDALLGSLADNGGPTRTHALLSGSPAIDAGASVSCPATDQRGVTRPQNGDGNGAALCDMGAYELQPTTTLGLTKSDAPDPVVIGATITYTLTLTNNGPASAPSVWLTDPLSPLTSYRSSTASQGGCSNSNGTVSCDLGAMPSGASATVTITVTTVAAGTATNTATARSGNSLPQPATTTTQINPAADLALILVDTPDPVTVDNPLTYAIGVNNSGPSPATNVTVTDTLPSGVALLSAAASQGSCSGTITITCTLGTLGVGGGANIAIAVRPLVVGSLANSATVTAAEADPATGNNTASVTTTVNSGADLLVIMTDSPDPVAAGSSLTYTIHVGNNGPSTATGVSLTDTLPQGVSLGSVTTSQGNCVVSTSITCTVGSLASGTTATITIVVTPNVVTTISNQAHAQANEADPDPANNTATEQTTVLPASATVTPVPTATPMPSADLAITKSASPASPRVGTNLNYALTVTNNGPGVATGVNVTDQLPSNVQFISARPSQGTCGAPNPIVCSIGNLAVGASATINIVVQPTQAGSLTNSASVAGNQPDPSPANNAAGVTSTAQAASCATRPPVQVSVQPVGGGRLQATLTVGTNASAPSNQFLGYSSGRVTNALIDIPGGPSGVTSFASAVPAGTPQLVFFIRQADPSQGASVELAVSDNCGDWPTVVGGGPAVFQGGGSAPNAPAIPAQSALTPLPGAAAPPPTATPGRR
jgi:uncharacterized repeat protein (TIGR01451 family)